MEYLEQRNLFPFQWKANREEASLELIRAFQHAHHGLSDPIAHRWRCPLRSECESYVRQKTSYP